MLSGDPEMPQNVTANQRIDNTGNCFLLMNWNPPLNLDKEDISCYQVYVNDTNNFKENLTLTAYPVHTCGSHTIRVTAFNRCDLMSPNSSTITVDQDPSPLQSIFLTTQSTTPESESPSGKHKKVKGDFWGLVHNIIPYTQKYIRESMQHTVLVHTV